MEECCRFVHHFYGLPNEEGYKTGGILSWNSIRKTTNVESTVGKTWCQMKIDVTDRITH
jgi:hypothetical protein